MSEALGHGPVCLARAELSLFLEDALRGLEPPRDVQAGRGGEMVQRVVADGPRALDGAPPPPGATEVRDVPPDRRQQLVRLLEPATQREEQQPHDRQQRPDRDDPQQRHPAVVLQDAGERDAILLGALAVRGHLIGVPVRGPVLHPGARRHEHLPAGQARTPREVDRVAVQPVVVEAEPLPDLFGEEHRAAVDREDLEHAIELTLIDLPGLQRRHGVPEAIDRTPHIAQGARVLQVDDLGADDADPLRSLQRGRLDEVGDGVGVEHRVAMQEQDVVGRGGHRQGQRDAERSAVPERVFVADHPLRTEGSDEEVDGCRRSSRRRSRGRRRWGRSARRARGGTRGGRGPPRARRGCRGPTGACVGASWRSEEGVVALMRGAVLARRRA